LCFDIFQGEICDKDPGDLLSGMMTGITFLTIIYRVDVSKDLLSGKGSVNDGLIQGIRGLVMTGLAGGVTDVDAFAYFLIINGDDDPPGPVQDKDILNIRVLMGHFKDIFHLSFILG
jgi:hypothetical protein